MSSAKQEVQKLLEDAGVEVDDVTLARLTKAVEEGRSEDALGQFFRALGASGFSKEDIQQIVALAEKTESAEEFVDAMFIGPCPFCDSESTRSLTDEPGVEDPTVGECKDCKKLFCSECHSELSRKQPSCTNEECWLNQPEEDEDIDEEEPEL
ncbi:MAG: hypothetical protein AB2A00_17795 [Myxococcota bacterium]